MRWDFDVSATARVLLSPGVFAVCHKYISTRCSGLKKGDEWHILKQDLDRASRSQCDGVGLCWRTVTSVTPLAALNGACDIDMALVGMLIMGRYALSVERNRERRS